MFEPRQVEKASLLNEQQAAKILGVSVSFLQNDRVTRRHAIPYIKVGRLVRYRRPVLERWLESRTVDGAVSTGWHR
jgi:excisionase family DNA binding protein